MLSDPRGLASEAFDPSDANPVSRPSCGPATESTTGSAPGRPLGRLRRHGEIEPTQGLKPNVYRVPGRSRRRRAYPEQLAFTMKGRIRQGPPFSFVKLAPIAPRRGHADGRQEAPASVSDRASCDAFLREGCFVVMRKWPSSKVMSSMSTPRIQPRTIRLTST